MISLTFPAYDFNIKRQADKPYIFDPVRKKFILLTPEEWVRQHLICYFTRDLGYPKGALSVERSIRMNRLTLRYDIVVFDPELKPWMIVECKEPDVPLTDAVLHQLLRYHQILQAEYWVLSNGHQHFCAQIGADRQVKWRDSLPAYQF